MHYLISFVLTENLRPYLQKLCSEAPHISPPPLSFGMSLGASRPTPPHDPDTTDAPPPRRPRNNSTSGFDRPLTLTLPSVYEGEDDLYSPGKVEGSSAPFQGHEMVSDCSTIMLAVCSAYIQCICCYCLALSCHGWK